MLYLKIFSNFLLIYLLYFIATTGVVTNFYPKESSQQCRVTDSEKYYGDEVGADLISLNDSHEVGLMSRINLIENAEDTMDIIQFYIKPDRTGTIFIGKIIEAADRGVKVRLIIDGKYNNISGFKDEIIYALVQHPNIKLKRFEPFNPIKPWTINNLLHDKLLIVDKEQAIISGRNIADRYFSEDVNNYVYDLDTIVTLNDNNNYQNSVIKQMNEYFSNMWNHHYTKDIISSESNKKSGKKQYQEIIDKLKEYETIYPDWFNQKIDWKSRSVKTRKVNLIANPFERFNKEPVVWCVISSIINNAKESVFINSPYVVPTDEIRKRLLTNDNINIVVLTNSAAGTPNLLGFSGYLRYKKDLLKMENINLYEYQGKGSLHSKTYIVDNRISMVGSYNLDPRSTFLSTETMLVVDSEEFAEQLEKTYHKYLSNSLIANDLYQYEVNSEVIPLELPKAKKVKLDIIRYIAYVVDHLL